METEQGEIEQGVAAVRRAFTGAFPQTALVLGSGLGAFADSVEGAADIAYADIPGFPVPTVAGHAGRLRIGTLAGAPLACLEGRFHAYEGHPARRFLAPIRVLRQLGVERLILTNAAGGLKPALTAGMLMIVTDHINFSGQNPLTGPNDDRFGPRFFDMSRAYDPVLRAKLKTAGLAAGIAVTEGVYVYVPGPSFETPAEVRMFAMLGGDAVGMSTVPECLAAVHCGMKVAALSVITNPAAGLGPELLTHRETLTAAEQSCARVARLLTLFLRAL